MSQNVPFRGVVFSVWGVSAGTPYRGTGPLRWAALTSRLNSETELSLADEMSGPLAQLMPTPQDNKPDDPHTDPLAGLKSDITKARGGALMVPTMNYGWDEGKGNAPQRDYGITRLGPQPPEIMAKIMEVSFNSVLSACGTPAALFQAASDGTSQRESLRRYHMNTILPCAKLLSAELTSKFETQIELKFDLHATDLAGRASSFQKFVAGGMAIEQALALSGLLVSDSAD